MRNISAGEAQAIAVSCLGFDPEYTDLVTPETLAALIRKVASFLCPCSTYDLIRAVSGLLRPIQAAETSEDAIWDACNSMIAYGDLVEASSPEIRSRGTLLYLAPPSFIPVSEQLFLIFGIVPDGEDVIPPALNKDLTCVVSGRRLRVVDSKEVSESLIQAGFIRIKLETWLRCPSAGDASALVDKYNHALLNSGFPGTPSDVTILEPDRPVKYYKGRWIALKNQTGKFLARRSQAYGSPLWCYIEAAKGRVTRLLDFPYLETHWNAFDEAWHLSQAIDAVAGHPQLFGLRREGRDKAVLDFFSPIPSWATRRLESIGERILASSALFSYVFANSDVEAECRFLAERMWLRQT